MDIIFFDIICLYKIVIQDKWITGYWNSIEEFLTHNQTWGHFYNFIWNWQMPLVVVSILAYIMVKRQLSEMSKQNQLVAESIRLNEKTARDSFRPYATMIYDELNRAGVVQVPYFKANSTEEGMVSTVHFKCSVYRGYLRLRTIFWGYDHDWMERVKDLVLGRVEYDSAWIVTDEYLTDGEMSGGHKIVLDTEKYYKNIFTLAAIYEDLAGNFYLTTAFIDYRQGTILNSVARTETRKFSEYTENEKREIMQKYSLH
jgi:hypothetical protein